MLTKERSERKLADDPYGWVVHQIEIGVIGEPVAAGGNFIERGIPEGPCHLKLQEPLNKERSRPFVPRRFAAPQIIQRKKVAMVVSHAHEHERNQQDVEAERPDMVVVERIKIVAAQRHQDAARLREEAEGERGQGEQKQPHHHPYEPIRALRHQAQDPDGKE